MTITLEGQPEIPIHPLDVTTESISNPSSSSCVGLIQTDGGELDTFTDVDIILGVAFLRNVYTVMAYDVPNASGQFPPNGNDSTETNPRIGLLSLTNATQALQEFNNVRVLNQPLTSGSTPSSRPAADARNGKLSVGVDVLLGLVGVIAACAALFGLRWFLVRRRLRRNGPGAASDAANDKRGGVAYQLAHRSSTSSSGSVSDPALVRTSLAGNSARTFVAQDDEVFGEFGQMRRPKDSDSTARDPEREVSYLNLDPSDPTGWRDTLVDSTTVEFVDPESKKLSQDVEQPVLSSTEIAAAIAAGLFPLSPDQHHRHTASEVSAGSDAPAAVEPLLPTHVRDNSASGRGSIVDDVDDDDLAELGRSSMAGVGTAARSPRIRAHHASGAGSMGSIGSFSLGGPNFPSIAPGERVSAYSFAEGALSSPPPPPPPPPL
jgi:hypothetical protein